MGIGREPDHAVEVPLRTTESPKHRLLIMLAERLDPSDGDMRHGDDRHDRPGEPPGPFLHRG
jgi:hypothetical protein